MFPAPGSTIPSGNKSLIFVSDLSPSEGASSVGVAIFAEDQEAGPAVQSLLSAVPTG
jgi:hypothetical protein